MNPEERVRRVLIVGAGGLGCPAGRALAQSGDFHIRMVDNDRVDLSNLHRQILFTAADEGAPKAQTAASRLEQIARKAATATSADFVEVRFVPDNAAELIDGFDLVLDGSDNFATKFLIADACKLAGVPSVHAGAVRWSGWALGVVPGRSACLRCVFEDVPKGRTDTCAEAGVVGPVVGVLGAAQATIAVELLLGKAAAAGILWSYQALDGTLRRSSIKPRPGCPLCEAEIDDLALERYAPSC